MKQLIYLVLPLLTAVLATPLKGQDFYAGPIVGAAFTQVDGDTYQGYEKAGLVVGGFVGRKLSKHWKAQLDIIYIEKGSRKTLDIEKNIDADYLIDLKYIQFPVTLRLTTGQFSFEGGLSLASLLSYYEEAYQEEIPEDDQVPFKKTELASVFGISYHILPRLMINIRNNYSITRIREPYNGEVEVYNPHWDKRKPGQYNNVVTLSLYYNLFKGKR